MLILLENILFTSKWVMISSPWIDFTRRLYIRGRRLEGMNLFETQCTMCSLIHFSFFMVGWLKNMRSRWFIFSSLIPTWSLWWLNFIVFMVFITYLMKFFLPNFENISCCILILFFSLLIIVLNSLTNFIIFFSFSD